MAVNKSVKLAALRKAKPKPVGVVVNKQLMANKTKYNGGSVVTPAGSKPVFSTGVANASGRPVGEAPRLTLPNGTPTVVPIAPPAIDPFLTPTDMATQNVENGQWDDYLAGLDLQQTTQESDVGLKTGDIDRSLASGLDNTDWNMAARGLQVSSVKDQAKAQMSTAAAAARNNETDKLQQFKAYNAGQKKQVNTVYKPAIKTKYDTLAVNNAEKARQNQPQPVQDAADGGAAPAVAAAGGPAFTPQTVGTQNPSQAPTTEQLHGSSNVTMTSGPKAVVKNGGFYHVYNEGKPNERWVYMRPATSRR